MLDRVRLARHDRVATFDQCHPGRFPSLGMVGPPVQIDRLPAVAAQARAFRVRPLAAFERGPERIETQVEPADDRDHCLAKGDRERTGQFEPSERTVRVAPPHRLRKRKPDQRVTTRIDERSRPGLAAGRPDPDHRDALVGGQPERRLALAPPVALVGTPLRREIVGRHQHHQDRTRADLVAQLVGERRHRIDSLPRPVAVIQEQPQVLAKASIRTQLPLELARERKRPRLQITLPAAIVAMAVAHEHVMHERRTDVGHAMLLSSRPGRLRPRPGFHYCTRSRHNQGRVFAAQTVPDGS